MLASIPRRCLATAFCLFPLAATAEDLPPDPPITTLPDIVVTASRAPEPLADVVGDVTVIGPEQLRQAGADSLTEIIGQAPGVQFTSNGGPQTASRLFIRGANAQQTLVLIDGMRATELISGGARLEAIDPAMVERVEILRGAASSLYGSDAIGGVINIITKKGDQDRPLSAWANLGYGTYETVKASAGVSGASHGWDYSLSASASGSRGFDVMRARFANGAPTTPWGHDPDRDGYDSRGWSGTLGYRWAPGHHLGLTAYNDYLHADSDGSQDDFPWAPEDNVRSLVRQQSYRLTSTDQISERWESVLSFGWGRDALDYRRPTEGSDRYASTKRTLSWQNNLQLAPDQRLSVLAERLEERLSSTVDYDRTARTTDSGALIYKGRVRRLQTQASLRNDHITGYGNQVTGSLGLDLDLTEVWQIGIAGSTGFHAPTFADLYQNSPEMYYRGNPDLKPEKSRNVEAHAQYQDETTRLRLTAFQNKVSELIINVTDPVTWVTSPQNVDRATLRGLTLTGEQVLGATTLRASADLLDPRNDAPRAGEGAQLPLRARQVLRLGVEHRLQALMLGAEYQYTGKRYADAANRVPLGGYALVNLTAAYDFSKTLGLQVRWNNVLDKDYVRVDGYRTPGSNVFVNLSWKM